MINSRIALVTGASSGIGQATAVRLARAGYQVYGSSRRGAADVRQAPRLFEMLQLDVTDEASIQAAINQIIGVHGRIDLLVNNAGFGISAAAAEESSMAQARALFDTNFFGLIRMTAAVIPHMRRQQGGRIVNIGSVLGFLPMPYMALYAASKHAVAGYSESLDHELRSFGIRVAVIEPAYTHTAFGANLMLPDQPLAVYDQARSGIDQLIRRELDHAVGPEVVAETVLQAATESRPRLRYTAGASAKRLRWLRRFIPARLFDIGMRKGLRLPSWR